jgi:hypothetical protein
MPYQQKAEKNDIKIDNRLKTQQSLNVWEQL